MYGAAVFSINKCHCQVHDQKINLSKKVRDINYCYNYFFFQTVPDSMEHVNKDLEAV